MSGKWQAGKHKPLNSDPPLAFDFLRASKSPQAEEEFTQNTFCRNTDELGSNKKTEVSHWSPALI